MYDIDIYSYKEKPGFNNRYYNILPLDENGLKKYYFGEDSHVRVFLNKRNPILIRKLMMIHNDNLKHNIVKSKSQSFATVNYSKMNLKEEKLEHNSKKPKILNKKEIKYRITRPLNEENRKYHENLLFRNKLYMNNSNKFNNTFKKSESVKNMSIDKMNKYNKNKNNIPLLYKPNIFFQSFHRKMNFKDIFGYNQTFRRKNLSDLYNISMSYLKHNIDQTLEPEKKNKYNRYHSFTDLKMHTQLLNNKLNFTLGIDNLNRENNKDKLIKSKNKSLKQILLNQTNKNFLKKYHLPDVRKIADNHKLISKINNRNPKYFGDKYNPNSYDIEVRTIKGTNYVGAPFKVSEY